MRNPLRSGVTMGVRVPNHRPGHPHADPLLAWGGQADLLFPRTAGPPQNVIFTDAALRSASP